MAVFKFLHSPNAVVGLSYPHPAMQVNEVHEKNGLLEYSCGPRCLRAAPSDEIQDNQIMQKIPDFTEQELWMIHTTLRERYGKELEIQLADTELRLNPALTDLTLCPTAYWEYEDCHFLIFKLGPGLYNGQFYYRVYQMYGTGRNEYDDISECVVTLLQVQADHDRSEDQEADNAP